MASPQKENGYTPIANELLERLILFDFPSASPLKIWLFVARKTYGYRKKIDYLSLTQIQAKTHLARPTIVFWLDWLVKSLLLVKGQSSQKGTVYGLNKDFEAWVVNPLELVKRKPPGSNRGLTHKRYNKRNNIVPNGTALKNTMEEITYEPMGDDGQPLAKKPKTFGRYPGLIAKYYALAMDKRGSLNGFLKASKELMQLAAEDFPKDSQEEHFKEIKGRIDVAVKHYKSINCDWHLNKLVENWNQLPKWNKELK